MMNLYSIALFLHIVGALGFFVALGLETFNLQQLQRLTSVEQLRGWFAATRGWRGLAAISMLVILVAGVYMTFAAWRGGSDWVAVAFVAMIVQGAIAGILTAPRQHDVVPFLELEMAEVAIQIAATAMHEDELIPICVAREMLHATVEPPEAHAHTRVEQQLRSVPG